MYPHVYNLWSRSRSQIPDPNSHSLCRASGLVVCSASDLVPCPRSHSMFSASDLVPSPRSHSMFSASDLVPSPRSHSMFRASGLILRPLGMQSQSSTKIEGSVATMLSNGVSDLLHVYVCTHHLFFVCLFVCLSLFVFVQSGHDGFVIDPNGRSFMGRLSADLKLCGKVRCMNNQRTTSKA